MGHFVIRRIHEIEVLEGQRSKKGENDSIAGFPDRDLKERASG